MNEYQDLFHTHTQSKRRPFRKVFFPVMNLTVIRSLFYVVGSTRRKTLQTGIDPTCVTKINALNLRTRYETRKSLSFFSPFFFFFFPTLTFQVWTWHPVSPCNYRLLSDHIKPNCAFALRLPSNFRFPVLLQRGD